MLALLYVGIAATPEPELQDFVQFTEADLSHGQGARSAAILEGAIKVIEAETPRATLLDACRLLRALEQTLIECDGYIQSDRDEDLEAQWRTSDGHHYVIPRVKPLDAPEGRPFLRRGLRHFRVIPTLIDDHFKVRLHRTTGILDPKLALAERQSGARLYGAALFPGLCVTLDVDEAARTFIVTGLSGVQSNEQIAKHLDEGRVAACSAWVWGELTMPADSVAFLRAKLGREALDGHYRPRYLVAGSWHHDSGAGVRNTALILDGEGEILFSVDKWAKFEFEKTLEGIAPGDEVHVLIGHDELMVVAICRDFLHAVRDSPYNALNVDVAIVPSMISAIDETRTMVGHAATANAMRVRYGTRTMVVAQPAIATADKPVGQVLAFPDRPLSNGAISVDGAWHLCRLEAV